MDKFGLTGTDIITGFSGTIVGFAAYISGCNQLLLSPKVKKDGSHNDGQWFDEQRIEVIAKSKRVVLDNGATPGFDKAAPVR